jgi:transmembrane 9 superfamily member 2/4
LQNLISNISQKDTLSIYQTLNDRNSTPALTAQTEIAAPPLPSSVLESTQQPSTMRLQRHLGTYSVLETLLLLAPISVNAFYLPGVAPTSYAIGDRVPLNVNHLTPADSENSPNVRSVFAFDYYNPEFHFCQPDGGPKTVSESLGSILFGDRIFTSPFELRMGDNQTCQPIPGCGEVTFEGQDGALVNQRILQHYNMNWLIDGLPAGQVKEDNGVRFETPGFPLGQVDEAGESYLNNHYDIWIDYHQAGEGAYRVVGVVVEPFSIADSKILPDGSAECPGESRPKQLSNTARTKVVWTYSVFWRPSPTSFATRWDKYLHVYDPKIHWFSLINSAVIVCFLVGMVSTILIRTLRKDIARYNRLDQVALEDLSGTGIMDDGVQEDSGWKLVHGDVFRPPKLPLPLAVLLGNGAQLFMMAGFTIGLLTLQNQRKSHY